MRPAHRLIREADRIPPIPEPGQDEGPSGRDRKLFVRLFNPYGSGTWYVAEYDPETETAFGIAHIFEWEWGYFSIAEMRALRKFGAPQIERDLHFSPTRAGDVSELAGLFREVVT